MLTSRSLLPRAYDQIVRIYVGNQVSLPVFPRVSVDPMIQTLVETPVPPPFEPMIETTVETPVPPVPPVPLVPSTMIPTPRTSKLTHEPFVDKPVIVTKMDESQLLQANPTLTEEFMKQRQEFLDKRAAASTDHTEPSVPTTPDNVTIPPFDHHQQLLLHMRQKAERVESKQDKDMEQPMPGQTEDVLPKPLVTSSTLLPASESKQLADTNQPIVVPRSLNSLSAPALRQLAVQHNIKGRHTKTQLIALLNQVGVYSV